MAVLFRVWYHIAWTAWRSGRFLFLPTKSGFRTA